MREQIRDWVSQRANNPAAGTLQECLVAFRGLASEATIKAYHHQVRKELGLTRVRNISGSKGPDVGPVTADELIVVKELGVDEIQKAVQAIDLIRTRFGSPERVARVLDAYEKFSS